MSHSDTTVRTERPRRLMFVAVLVAGALLLGAGLAVSRGSSDSGEEILSGSADDEAADGAAVLALTDDDRLVRVELDGGKAEVTDLTPTGGLGGSVPAPGYASVESVSANEVVVTTEIAGAPAPPEIPGVAVPPVLMLQRIDFATDSVEPLGPGLWPSASPDGRLLVSVNPDFGRGRLSIVVRITDLVTGAVTERVIAQSSRDGIGAVPAGRPIWEGDERVVIPVAADGMVTGVGLDVVSGVVSAAWTLRGGDVPIAIDRNNDGEIVLSDPADRAFVVSVEAAAVTPPTTDGEGPLAPANRQTVAAGNGEVVDLRFSDDDLFLVTRGSDGLTEFVVAGDTGGGQPLVSGLVAITMPSLADADADGPSPTSTSTTTVTPTGPTTSSQAPAPTSPPPSTAGRGPATSIANTTTSILDSQGQPSG